jgi:methylmalonyl-CoA/ethylmalonyl-CoA epimerase
MLRYTRGAMITKIHHVGVVVRDMEQAMRFWRDTLGLRVHKQQAIEEQGVKAALMTIGDSEIELLEPTVTDNGIARYLKSRGEGLHHVCFQVDSVDRDLDALKAKEIELIDQQPRIGIAGRICFLHPRAMHGTLVELCEPIDDPERA